MSLPYLRPGRPAVLWSLWATGLLAGATGLSVPAAAADPVPHPPYRGVAVHATTPAGGRDLVLDVEGSTTDDNAQVGLERYTGANDQLWQIAPLGGDRFEIRNVHSRACLDVRADSGADDAEVIQHACHGGRNQGWRAVALADGGFQIIARSGKCLDGYSTTSDVPVEGAKVVQTACATPVPSDQRWLFGHH